LISQTPGEGDLLPFSQNIQFLTDDVVGLNALFERVFYGSQYSSDALAALSRIRFRSKPLTSAPQAVSPESTRYILLNRGESGIGKTRVFRQFRQKAAERRIPVYEIHCYDVEGIPFKPFLRVIREILRDFELSETLRQKYRHALENLLPDIYRLTPLGPPAASTSSWSGERRDSGEEEAERIRIFDSLTQLLFEITALKPVVVLVHDLHCGDQSTIDLLRYIGRNLQLRNSLFSGAGPRRRDSASEPLARPRPLEAADEDGEWRELASRAWSGPGSFLDAGPDDQSLESSPEPIDDRPVRLMILANYCGFAEEGHYLERALRSLGEEPFAFHSEIRTLSREEAGTFIERSLEANPKGDPPVGCRPEAVDVLFELSQGFPSYIHEIFRLLHFSGAWPAAAQHAGILDSALISTAVGAVTTSPPRFQILKSRLRHTTPLERDVLAVLALARKPLTAEFLSLVLSADGRPLDGIHEVLDRLEHHSFIERVRHEFPLRREESGYYFRIADYTAVAAEDVTPEAQRRIHQRIGEEYRKLLEEDGDERAFEIFHHLRRGEDPAAAVTFGILAAQRLARSFSLQKAVQVCDEVLEILAPTGGQPAAPASRKGETPAASSSALLRWEVLGRKATLHLRLKEYSLAEAAVSQILKEGGTVLGDRERFALTLRLGEIANSAGEPNRSLKVLSKAFRWVKEDEPTLAARLHIAVAQAHLDRQDPKRAINFCLNGLKIAAKLQAGGAAGEPAPELGGEEVPRLNRLLAWAHTRRGDASHAVDHFQRGLDGLERLGKKDSAAELLDDLGRVYMERGNYFRAARYLYKSLEIKRRRQDILALSRSYEELGRVYLRTGDELKTIEYLNRSLYLKERVGDLAGLNPTLGTLGDLYSRLGQFQRATRYFKREVDNSQLLADTRGLVEGFLHLGWLYYEVGELKQAESLCRQIAILSGEFKLRVQEAEGARLRGSLEALGRDWNSSEKHLRQAIEIHTKLGDRRREAESLLGLAEIKFHRELYDESLKLASKAQVIAEGLHAVDLQARSQIAKGNVYRFLKGGTPERAKELLRRALDLGQPLNDVRLLFDLFYSLAKVYHYDREFAEAGNFYGKAEAILRRIADGLAEDVAATYFEDRRRKLFFEDAARFRKEVQSRTASGSAIDLRERTSVVDLKEKPAGLPDYKDLTLRLLRVHAAVPNVDFCSRLLAEGLELVKAERGFVLRVQNRQYGLAAASGFGDDPLAHPEYSSAQTLAEEAVRRGRLIICGGTEEDEKQGKVLRPSGPSHRSVLAAPLMTAERVFGVLYLDRPLSLGRFSSRDQVMAEAFSAHGGCALENRRQYESAIREPVTGFLTPTYFLDQLKDAFRLYNLHGRTFHLLGFFVPTLEASISGTGGLGEKVYREVFEVLPRGVAASWWNPIFSVLLLETDLSRAQGVQMKIAEKLRDLLKEEVEAASIVPEARFPDGARLYAELRRVLLPEECDTQTLTEIRRLLAQDLSLKDAKKVLEKHIIESTLRKTGGNITHAARELGIHRPQLSNLLKKYALKRELFEREFDIRLNALDN